MRLNQAMADFALLTFENQEWFMGHIGTGEYSIDLDAQTLVCAGQTYRVALLGTWSEELRTWMWGWGNSQTLPADHPVHAAAVALRGRAEELGMPELATRTFPTEGINDLQWHPAMGLASVATGLVGGTAMYSSGYPGGRAFMAVMDGPAPRSNPLKFPRFSTQAWDAAAASPTRAQDGVRHRETLRLYAIRRGLRWLDLPDGGMVLEWPGGSKAEMTFDDHGMETNLKLTIEPADDIPKLPFEEENAAKMG